MSDYVSGLRQDLVEAAARQQAAGRGARVARPLRPRAWSPVAVLGAAAAVVAALVLVFGLRAVSPPRPPEAPKVVGRFHIEVQPRDAVAAAGHVIVADYGGQLLRIDPQTLERRRIATTADGALPVSLAEHGDAVWAIVVHPGPGHPHSTLLNLDAQSGQRLAAVPLTDESGAIAVGAGGIWRVMTVRTRQSLYAGVVERIDPRTGRRTAGFHGDSQAIAASGRFVWTRNGETVTQRDERGVVVNRVRGISPAVGFEDQRSMLADDDGAWVVGQSDGLLYRIENGRVVKRLRVGQLAGAIARTRSAVWVTAMVAADRFELVRVDPDGVTVTGRVAIGSDQPQSILPVGKQVWVITETGAVVRVSPE